MPQPERRTDRWVAVLQSVLLHGVIVGLLVFGWWSFRHRPQPPPSLALDATVVSANALNGTNAPKTPAAAHAPPVKASAQAAAPAPKPAVPAPAQPPPSPGPPQPVPQPSAADDQTVPVPADLAARAAAQKAQEPAQSPKQPKAQAQRKSAKALNAARAKAAARAKRRAEQKRLAKAELKAKAKLKAEKLAAERKRRAEQAKLKAELARRAAEAKALALNQADLSASVAAEEKSMDARSGPALASWVQQITARIEQAWIRPPSAKPGIDCFLDVTQVPGGEIVNVKVGTCNGDGAVIQSIQDAAYRASPLPPPPDPTLFERDLQIEFKPN